MTAPFGQHSKSWQSVRSHFILLLLAVAIPTRNSELAGDSTRNSEGELPCPRGLAIDLIGQQTLIREAMIPCSGVGRCNRYVEECAFSRSRRSKPDQGHRNVRM